MFVKARKDHTCTDRFPDTATVDKGRDTVPLPVCISAWLGAKWCLFQKSVCMVVAAVIDFSCLHEQIMPVRRRTEYRSLSSIAHFTLKGQK